MKDRPLPKRYKDKSLSSFNALWRRYRRKAEKYGRPFELTRSVFRRLTKSPCGYCGQAPASSVLNEGASTPYIYNGIDRIDNALGYTEANVVPCCGMCNKMKWAYPVKDFLDQIQRIAYQLQLLA